jgi:Ca2+-binding EF-hand superfamily protein
MLRPPEFIAAALSAILLTSPTACSTTNGESVAEAGAPRLFDMADRDRDKVITLTEWDTRSEQVFETLDANGDGRLDTQELESGFDSFDQNNSGTIDVREAPVLVSQADVDGDNVIGSDEFQTFDWSKFKGDVNDDGLVSPKEFRRPRRELFYESDLDRNDRLNRYEFDDSARVILFQW